MKFQRITKRSKTAIIAYRIYENWSTKRRFKSGNTESSLGSTHRGRTVSESLSYINTQVDDYVAYWGIPPSAVAGKRVLEIGFGDNVGVALRFIALGASHVTCLDKFYATRDTQQEHSIYSALREMLDDESRARFDEAIELKDTVSINPQKIRCIYGVDLEDSRELADGPPFDLVISRAALQDIYQPESAFAAMNRLLIPGGYMIHKIDLSDQGMFVHHGMNPLTFLTIQEPVYRLMANGSGRPNRKLIGDYFSILKALKLDARLLITDVIGRKGKGDLRPHQETLDIKADHSRCALDFVKEIRPRLIDRFKRLSDVELMISGIFMIARKPTESAEN